MPVPSALTARRRDRELAALAEGWCPDVLVIGAGFTGAGIALDAALRGLSVAVVDRADLANGTSRWSSKLVHGGLRYLAKGDIALARESAAERGILMESVAPHLTRSLSFVTPVNAGVPSGVALLAGIGYGAGNLLRVASGTSAATLARPRIVGPAATRKLVPAVGTRGLRGGLVNTDGQLVDDARMVVTIARTAAAYGAAVLPHVAASAVTRDAVTLTDTRHDGGSFTARAGRVVVAAGVWSDTLDDRVRLRPSKGVHLVINGAALGHPTAALTTPVPGSVSRFVFLLPQPDGRVYLGLTDDPVHSAVVDEPPVLAEEQEWLLDVVNRVLERPLTNEDVVGGYAGYRPLVAGSSTDTADLSRVHVVIDEGEGPLTVVGGKLTTYRRMAADVVDRLTARPCTTDRQPLVGSLPRARMAALPHDPWLVSRYGAEAGDVEALIVADPALGQPVVEGLPYLRAELVFSLRREGALSASDLVDRRTRIGLVPQDRVRALPVAQYLLDQTGAG